VIRNAVIHLNGEQPLLADLYEPPSPGDVGLRCTNLRDMSGKRPVFVDDSKSIFFFPYLHMRFVEIPPGAIAGADAALEIAGQADASAGVPTESDADSETELEIDEEFLRRIREV
jgi:hypothetical protein